MGRIMTNWIAIVENDRTTLKVATRILSNNNFRVSAMNSGQALLSFLKDNKPDLILTEAKMPEMSGVEVLKSIRALKGSKSRIPVMFLVCGQNCDCEQETEGLDVAQIIKKPFSTDDFVESIKKYLADNGRENDDVVNDNDDTAVSRDDIDHTGVEVDEKIDLEHLNRTLIEKQDANTALWVDNRGFKLIYRFFSRYIESYKGHACKVLFTFSVLKEVDGLKKTFGEMMEDFGDILKNILRKSDVVVQSKPNQFLLLLPEVDEEHLDSVLDRIEHGWTEYEFSDYVAIIYEREMVAGEESGLDERKQG